MKDLKVRVTSGVIGTILMILVVKMGNPILSIAVALFSLIGMKELFNAFENKGLKPLRVSAYTIVVLSYAFGMMTKLPNNNLHMQLFITIISMYFLIMLLTKKYKVEDVGVTMLSLFYIPFLFSYLARLGGSIYIWLIFLVAFGTDTFAYFAGNLFGKHKLCPEISPNKTVEGFVGGIVGSVLLTMIYCYLVGVTNIMLYIPMAIIASMISQSGDLVASVIKRYTGIKDYGKLIPGHGGILDRFDSVIFTSPVIFYYIELIIK